jgi:glyoxylase-like metal-dependent hydrolase (beta-lactamase superfamily II)
VNTHWHGDHTGGNEAFGKRGAVILAHANVRKRMSTEQFLAALNQKVPPSPKDALPVVTFGDGVTLHLNGDTLHVVHVANAHTDGDSLVHWQRANVLHMGDTFFHRQSFPFIDLSSGGSIDGLVRAIDTALSISNASTRIIPAMDLSQAAPNLLPTAPCWSMSGPRSPPAFARAAALPKSRPLSPASAYGMPNGFITPDRFVEAVYNSLRAPCRRAPARRRQAAQALRDVNSSYRAGLPAWRNCLKPIR